MIIMGNYKTTPEQRCEIYLLHKKGDLLNHDIAQKYGIKANSIRRIVKSERNR